jgi:hypothetical protein
MKRIAIAMAKVLEEETLPGHNAQCHRAKELQKRKRHY